MHAIGIDMSKTSFHVALNDSLVRKFSNTEEGIAAFLRLLQSLDCTLADTTIGVEATGVYHLLLCVRLKDAGYETNLVSPLESHRFAASQSVRDRKTDAIDAKHIRTMILAGFGRPFRQSEETIILKTLISERDGLVKLRASLKNRGEARQVRLQAVSHPVRSHSTNVHRLLSHEIRQLEKGLLSYAPDTQLLLRSIPGIGAVSAASIIAHIGDVRRFPSPEKLVAYIGLDCRLHQSGTSVNGKGYISRRGNSQLRSVLFNAAFIARQRNPMLKAYFDQKIREGKHYATALTAVERKLVHIIWAVWTRGTPFMQES